MSLVHTGAGDSDDDDDDDDDDGGGGGDDEMDVFFHDLLHPDSLGKYSVPMIKQTSAQQLGSTWSGWSKTSDNACLGVEIWKVDFC